MAVPAPSADDLRDAAAFAAVLGALSKPGTIHDLPEDGEGTIVAALLDRECRVHAAPEFAEAVALTGATSVPLERCDHALLGAREDADWVARAPNGSQLHPEGGATVILRAGLGQGTRLRLTGPGIDGAADVAIDAAPGLWAARAGAIRYPLGFDLLLIDGNHLMGVPRSTNVEVL
ncbi:MAG: phosphonate C-P lyase system protein PhnH [Pseudomonadota bacterium]